MKISIIHPSRGRPKMAIETARKWIKNASGKHEFDYVLSLDNDDIKLSEYYQKFNSFGATFTVRNNNNVVDAMNAGAKIAHGEILVCISDDFDCEPGWDEFIVSQLDIEKEQALKVNDCYTEPSNLILTMPVMTKKLYDKLGFVYYPEYSGMFADNDLAEMCSTMNVLKVNYEKKFEHLHWLFGKTERDETSYRHDNPEGWKLGDGLIQKRRANNFGVEKNPLLSVLLPSIIIRNQQFINLSHRLVDLVKAGGFLSKVEFKSNVDNKEISIGKKRQELLNEATGEYVLFIDDDDDVPNYYFTKIFEALESKPDCIGFKIDFRKDGKSKIACHSNRYKSWENNVDGYDFVRCPNHLNPIKREIALQAGYEDLRFGEDSKYSLKLAAENLIKSEVFINEIMYIYKFSSKENHKIKYGIR